MLAESLRDLAVPVDQLRPLPGNPRRGDVDAVARSLAEFGQRKPVVARRDGTVVAGNHTLRAVLQLGWPEIAVVWVDDDEARAKAYALADNRTSELGTFDDEDLAAMVAEVHAVDPKLLLAASFDGEDLEALLAFGRAPAEGLTDPDDVPDPPAVPVSQPGDVWLLGPHRVLCGDSTDAVAVEAMLAGDRADCMWTDPPYGVDYVGKTEDALTIENDGAAGLAELLAGAFAVATAAVKPGAPVYVAHADSFRMTFEQAMRDAGWAVRQNLIWAKNTLVLGRSDYHYRHEPILYGFTAGGAGRLGRGGKRWYGDNAQTTVFEVDKPTRSEDHPTKKPVELIVRMVTNSCRRRGILYDAFGGSGPTVIAAHQLGLAARVVELAPRFVDVICRRYQEHTGTQPILQSTGEPHDFA